MASQDKESVADEINHLEPKPEYEKIVKDPYVLEFLDLEPNPHFYEKDLEQAIIDHLQKFLLELGRGFSFVARQKKISFDGRNFYIDLVFYNYILKCFVLIDLKIGNLTHQDLGQMQMYVNYYTRELMNEYEIMEEFAYATPNPRYQEKLLRVLRGRKPYRNFKDEINWLGISESYYAWRLIALCRKAKNWCEENEVPYEIRTEGLSI